MKHFKSKVAAITGAGSGIGQQLAVLLAQAGANLALSDINAQGLADTIELVKPYSIKVTITQLDVSDREAMQAWAEDTIQQHGKVNLIFNNAGVAMASTIAGMSYDELEWMMGINFWGVIYGTKEFLPHLKASGEGHIINISSVFGLTAQPSYSAYNASKFAVRGFTESLRQELDIQNNGVSATCVHPGGIRTNIANAARISDNLQTLGVNPDKAIGQFNKLLRTPAKEAAHQILEAVRHNERRLLIGSDAKFLDQVQRLFPAHYPQVMNRLTKILTRKKKRSTNPAYGK